MKMVMDIVRKCLAFGAAFLLGILISSQAQAQQNLFNVPSGEITSPGEIFFQEQFNFARPAGSSNTTFDFGLGNGWEVGVNMLDVLFYQDDGGAIPIGPQQVNPDLLLNLQKGFEVNDSWKVGIGGQFGFNPDPHPGDIRFLNYSWIINEFDFPEHQEYGKWYAGTYYANSPYVGPGDSMGLLLGTEIPIIEDRLSFQSDWTTGQNDIGVVVIGGVYTFECKWQLSLGAQLPSPGTQNPYGVVIEITHPGAKTPKSGRTANSRLRSLR